MHLKSSASGSIGSGVNQIENCSAPPGCAEAALPARHVSGAGGRLAIPHVPGSPGIPLPAYHLVAWWLDGVRVRPSGIRRRCNGRRAAVVVRPDHPPGQGDAAVFLPRDPLVSRTIGFRPTQFPTRWNPARRGKCEKTKWPVRDFDSVGSFMRSRSPIAWRPLICIGGPCRTSPLAGCSCLTELATRS